MIGKPKYEYGDKVCFKTEKGIKNGTIAIIDKYGTFEQRDDVSYDILVETENCLYKHIPEPYVYPQKTTETDVSFS